MLVHPQTPSFYLTLGWEQVYFTGRNRGEGPCPGRGRQQPQTRPFMGLLVECWEDATATPGGFRCSCGERQQFPLVKSQSFFLTSDKDLEKFLPPSSLQPPITLIQKCRAPGTPPANRGRSCGGPPFWEGGLTAALQHFKLERRAVEDGANPQPLPPPPPLV